MSANVVQHPAINDPLANWPGFASVDAAGARIARDMLAELECTDMDANDITPAEYCELGNWPRHGLPFRNVVAEYAAKAQAAGPEALAAFYAVLSDFIAITCQGSVPESGNYDRLCAGEQGP